MEHHPAQTSRTAGLPRYPAPPTAPVPPRAAWKIGLTVALAVAAAGTLLGPVVAVLAFDLAPLHPLVLLLGLTVGAAYGLAVGVFTGAGTAVVVALHRSYRPSTRCPSHP